VGCAVLVQPDMGAVAHGLLVPSIPLGSGPLLLGVMGGVGGSVAQRGSTLGRRIC